VFLKRIEILGFKSFADRTHIDFNEGITALLGPNGCGKSNIVDSIKWVLGEQSTRNMRAEKMEDVIFSGTESRKALNVAEVTLIISNEENILDLDLPEISIKRRLYRSGESEYFVNNTLVKLKELKEIFYDTGIGKSAYSIMEQGKIDQVLSNKPEERRFLFEEAAGITRFKMKGSEAERKLSKTRDNMVQVENILSEVHKNYETLRKQSEKTLQYRGFREEMFSIDIDVQLLKYHQLKNNLLKKNEQFVKITDKKKNLIEKIYNLNGHLASNLDEVNSMESELIEDQKKLYGIDLEKENQYNRIKLLKEQNKEVESQIAGLKQKEKDIKDKMESLKQEEKDKQSKLQEYNDQLKDIENNILNFQKSIEASEGRINENTKTIKHNEQNIEKWELEQESLQENLRSLTDDIVHQLDTGLKESGISLKQRSNLKDQIQDSLQSLLIQLDGKLSIWKDAASVGLKKDDTEVWDSGVRSLKEIRASLAALKGHIDSYTGLEPDFLNDFLAPEGIITRKREIDEKLSDVKDQLKIARDIIQKKNEENRLLEKKIQEYRSTLEELRVNRARMATQVSAIQDNLKSLASELNNYEEMLRQNLEEIGRLDKRIKETLGKIKEAEKQLNTLDENKIDLQKKLKGLEKSIQSRNKDVSGKEGELKKKNSDLQNLTLSLEKYRVEKEHIEGGIENLCQNFRENNSSDISKYEDRIPKIKKSRQELKEDYGKNREKLKALGQVNLMAPEEFVEVKERYDFLSTQLRDLEQARENLIQVTSEIKKESTQLFIKTYDQIKINFHEIFRRMFGGGRAELKMVDPDNILESGIEIYAQPPGKKLENISLLSGGERSLTGVALLFATYMVKPSPFCILDEIDAALDDANIQRFVNVLIEFGEKSQFIVITHNKKTVTGAKTLLGITMQESGISKLLAMKIGELVHESV